MIRLRFRWVTYLENEGARVKRCSRNQVPEPLVSMKEWPGGQAVTLGPAGTSHREEGYTWYSWMA